MQLHGAFFIPKLPLARLKAEQEQEAADPYQTAFEANRPGKSPEKGGADDGKTD